MTEHATDNGGAGVRFPMPKAGDAAARSKALTVADIELFSALTGDRNPLHTDPAAAGASRFGSVIVQGGVITGQDGEVCVTGSAVTYTAALPA